MRIIIYYLLLLVFIAVLTGFLLSGNHGAAMNMQQTISVSALLVVYSVGLSLVGEGKTADERESMHRYYANRAALIAGNSLLSIGILIQLFTHNLDYWLLAGLIIINLTKIISFIYLNYRK